METADILKALPSLSVNDRLAIAEKALQLSHEEQRSLTQTQRRQQFAIAAASAISDYTPGSELLDFADLDGEDFYEEPNEAHA
ncbi:MAG: hypothetical protein LH702_31420 [Phormidesmis sp. CAN_BIN44]|nr:hypothetical protein [Phormidesmis sp. CAN_BIN44]